MSSTNIYDPISEALGIPPITDQDFHKNFSLPNDAKFVSSLGGFMISEDHIEEWKARISHTMKRKNAESNYWKVGVKAAADKVRGKKQSKSHKDKRAKAKNREIEIQGILYSSGKEAAKALGVKPSTISVWASRNGSRYNINIPNGSNQYVKR